MILGGGSNCQGCGCGPATPTRYVVAARGWTVPYLFSRSITSGGENTDFNDMLPSQSSTFGEFAVGADDTTYQGFGQFWCLWPPVDTSRASTTGDWTGTGGSAEMFVEVKWDGSYHWLRMRDDVYSSTTGFEAVFRRAVGSATTGSNVVGKVIFTASDIYSLQIDGVASTDYSGVGDLCYLASASAETDFSGKTFDITFASGAPSDPWFQTGSAPYYSVESLIGETFSLTLASVSKASIGYYSPFLPAWDITEGDCYEDTRSAGTWGRGCKVGIVTDGVNVSILASGSRTGGGQSTIVYGCSTGKDNFGASPTQRTQKGLVVQFHANWFDCFAVSGSAGTGPLAPWETKYTSSLGGPNTNTGWDSWWGSGGDLTIAVS